MILSFSDLMLKIVKKFVHLFYFALRCQCLFAAIPLTAVLKQLHLQKKSPRFGVLFAIQIQTVIDQHEVKRGNAMYQLFDLGY